MKSKKPIAYLSAGIFCLLSLSSCSYVKSTYTPDVVISTQPKKEYQEVEYLNQSPTRVALKIGIISSSGNGFSNFEDLVINAKKKAAQLGGDFILVENSGVNTQTVYSPGHSSYSSSGHLSWGSYSGHGNSQANAYSVGPSIYNVHLPWSKFSVWVYAPSQLGLRLNSDNVVTGFHLNSYARKAGVEINDKLVGVDGNDIYDEKVIHHLMEIKPGDKVKISLERGSKLVEYEITALNN